MVDRGESETRRADETSESRRSFAALARDASAALGSSWAFALACSVVLVWGITGPLFGFSDSWQLVINTGTTIVTFLMVFLIQNTQNRDTEAMQVKLDELIRATQGAHNALLDLEELDEETIQAFRKRYEALAAKARRNQDQGEADTGSPEC